MAKPNLTSLFAAELNLHNRINAFQNATNDPPQGAVDGLTNAIVLVDGQAAAILTAPPIPGPTGNLDFTAFDQAVKDFEADGRLLQQDVDNVTRVLTVNTK